MATNIGFDEYGRPYVEEGADEGRIVERDGILYVEPIPTDPTVFTIERSVDDGTIWEPVLGESPSTDGATLMDWESLSCGETLYRAIAETVEGATASTLITVEARSGALWLSGGVGYGETCRLPSNPKLQITAGRERARVNYAGRKFPVTYVGEALSRVVRVAGTTSDRPYGDEETANIEQLQHLAQSEEPMFLHRDPYGNRIYGSIDNIDLEHLDVAMHPDGPNGIWKYGFALTEAEA